MSDDIVTRLRRMDASIPSVDPDKYVSPTEAADEIERLRADRDRWLHIARRLYELMPERSSEALHRANALANYEEAVHEELEKRLNL